MREYITTSVHPQIFADLALNMQINSEDVTQKQYLDEGNFGRIFLASIKLEVKHKVFTANDHFLSAGRGDQAGGRKDVHPIRS